MVDQNSDISLGEIYRKQIEMAESLKTLMVGVEKSRHDLRDEFTAKVGSVQAQVMQHIGDVALLQSDVRRHEVAITEQAEKLDQVSTNAARVSGAAALLAFLLSAVPWPWKH